MLEKSTSEENMNNNCCEAKRTANFWQFDRV